MTEVSMVDLRTTGLPFNVIESMRSVFSDHAEIESVVLYGSRALGNFRAGSDIDLTIVGSLDHRELLKVELELDELMLPYKVDLSLQHEIDNASLIEHINRVGKVFYSAPVS